MLLKDMEIVSYEDAAAMLGVVKATVTNAVARGALTPLPRLRRKPGRLVKGQVELFIGKELSLANLTHEEAVIWHQINRVVNAHKKVAKGDTRALEYENVKDTIEIAGDLLDRIADLLIDVIGDILTSKDVSPESLITYIQQSPAFLRIADLLGMQWQEIPEETTDAIKKRAMQVAEKVRVKIATTLLDKMVHDETLSMALIAPEQLQGMLFPHTPTTEQVTPV